MGCAVSRPAYIEPVVAVEPVVSVAPVGVGLYTPAVATVGPSVSINTGYGYGGYGGGPSVVRENVYVNKTVNVRSSAAPGARSYARRGAARKLRL